MTTNTVFLITGANRGIGLGLTESLLRRPNTTVIATTRSSSVDASALQGLPTAANSKLVITTLSSNADTGAAAVIDEISKQGISHIDTVVANAGLGDAFHPVLATPVDEIRLNFEVNTLGPIKLFQAAFPLLEKATNPKFILISSVLGSIGGTEGELARAPTLAYGVSKAGANYFVRKVHCEHENVVAVAVHPGWVKTSNGQAFADSIGVPEPPMSLEQSVNGVLEQIDRASKTTTSGSFVSHDGSIIPW